MLACGPGPAQMLFLTMTALGRKDFIKITNFFFFLRVLTSPLYYSSHSSFLLFAIIHPLADSKLDKNAEKYIRMIYVFALHSCIDLTGSLLCFSHRFWLLTPVHLLQDFLLLCTQLSSSNCSWFRLRLCRLLPREPTCLQRWVGPRGIPLQRVAGAGLWWWEPSSPSASPTPSPNLSPCSSRRSRSSSTPRPVRCPGSHPSCWLSCMLEVSRVCVCMWKF